MTASEVRSRLLKSESDIERIYDVDFTDKSTAVEIQTLDRETGVAVAGRYEFGDGRVIPVNDLPTHRPLTFQERFLALPWWAHSSLGGTVALTLELIGKHLLWLI